MCKFSLCSCKLSSTSPLRTQHAWVTKRVTCIALYFLATLDIISALQLQEANSTCSTVVSPRALTTPPHASSAHMYLYTPLYTHTHTHTHTHHLHSGTISSALAMLTPPSLPHPSNGRWLLKANGSSSVLSGPPRSNLDQGSTRDQQVSMTSWQPHTQSMPLDTCLIPNLFVTCKEEPGARNLAWVT